MTTLPAPCRTPKRTIASGLVVGLGGGLFLLALGFVGWLLLGAVTDVWVDGCPDIAPPLAPPAWRFLHAWIMAPAWTLLAMRTGWRIGHRHITRAAGVPPPRRAGSSS